MYIFAMSLIPRLLGDALLSSDAKVVVLEGARAVGKTTLVRSVLQKRGFSYTSLADPSVLRRATSDPGGWLRGLTFPAIIDEAQLLEALPLLVKELVDEIPGAGTRVVLTGSASIARTGLGGADALTRRSRRFSMGPLTEWEIGGQEGSIVDLLFDAEIAAGGRTDLDESTLLDRLTRGGFPTYVVPDVIRTRRDLSLDLRSDIEGLLSDQALAGRGVDTLAARAALDGLMRTPGGIFNASRLAQQLDLDRRTIDRYLGVFERVFLTHHLPNLATAPPRQSHSRAKIHPVDTSFAVESMTRAGVDLRQDREALGALLESHVVNQLTTAAGWSDHEIRAFYWRPAEKRGRAVDLVMIDELDRTVGVEIKASRSVHERDIAGLIALGEGRGLHRGFVFHNGPEVIRLRENIWGLPLAVLDGSHPLGRAGDARISEREVVTVPDPIVGSDASIFISHVHADDASSRGRMISFAKDLADRYEFLTGGSLRLFIDRDDISWGENWRQRLRAEASTTTFLLSFVTPRYLSSAACREEFLDFRRAATADPGQKVLLPLIWVDPSASGVMSDKDPVWSVIKETQWVAATDFRLLEPESVEYDTVLDQLTQRLRIAVATVAKDRTETFTQRGEDPDEDRDLLETLESLEASRTDIERAASGLKDAIASISAVFSGRPPLRTGPTYATARALSEIGAELEQPVARLDHAAEELGAVWQGVDSDVSRLVFLLSGTPDEASKRMLFEILDGLVRALDVPGASGLDQQLALLGNLSRHLRPMSRSMSAALRLLDGVKVSARAWRDSLAGQG
ncbi:hypothetical protein EDF35_3986 [Rathayibacter sp. PhB151]|nr:hypothetical protein EDF35_3986 [Rathayibacter sp. PhB151]